MAKQKKEVKGLTEEQQGMFDKLTPLQKGMVVFTLKGKKPKEAHKLSGGKCKESNRSKLGSEILNKPEVAELLASIRGDVATEAKVDAAFILSAAKSIHDRCVQDVRPVLTARGEQVKDEDGNNIFSFDAKSALSALKIMGDHVDVMAFKQVVEHKADDDLAAWIRNSRKQVGEK